MTLEKRVPMRTCVGCGQKREKRDLWRIVRTPEGNILPDPAQKANGRGAYVCRNADCLQLALKKNGLSRSFREKTEGTALEELLNLLMSEGSPKSADIHSAEEKDGNNPQTERRDHG